jgi:hypothetical protein
MVMWWSILEKGGNEYIGLGVAGQACRRVEDRDEIG